MILIVGLGNPGAKYENTRHNIGFIAVDLLLKKLASVDSSVWEESKKFNCFLAKVENDLLLVKPLSFMNSSGEVVAKLIRFYKISRLGLYVIHDDIDLPLGKIKISSKHGSAGHKGVESVIAAVGDNNFVRIRIGVGGNKKVDAEKYVLAEFEKVEEPKIRKVVKKAAEAMETILKEGVERAANGFN